MIGHEIEARNGDDLVRFVRALGQHRYVSSRLHLVHAFVVEAACVGNPSLEHALAEARTWSTDVLANREVDRASKDERLLRRATDAELVAVLTAFWASGEHASRARQVLAERLSGIGIDISEGALPFDESHEDDMFPVLVDAGWELYSLRALDRERHRGAIDAFGDALMFDVAKFEEESAVSELCALHELPALGANELLHALEPNGRRAGSTSAFPPATPESVGSLRAPFVLWTGGNETYIDYVLRGVLRAAKLETT